MLQFVTDAGLAGRRQARAIAYKAAIGYDRGLGLSVMQVWAALGCRLVPRRGRHASLWAGAGVLWLAALGWHPPAAAPAPEAAALPQRDVLVLLSTGYGQAGIDNYAKGLYSRLRERGLGFTRIHIEYLDLVKNPAPAYRQALGGLLAHKYRDADIAAVVTLQPAALNFLLQEGQRIAPEAAVMVSQARVPEGARSRHRFYLQNPSLDFAGTLQRALELFPKTHRVVLLNGNSAVEQERQAEAWRQFQPWQGQLEFEYTDGQGLDEVERRLAGAPEHTVIIGPGVNRDGRGQVHVPVETLVRIGRSASAPVFPVYSVSIGRGPIGGMVTVLEDEGKFMAESVADYLGHPPEAGGDFHVRSAPPVPLFDWQQIQRWQGDWRRLPAHTVYLNRPPSLWGEYRAYVVGGGVVILVLLVLVVALALQNRRRLRAEQSLRASQERYQELALFDALTGLPNRKLLHDRMHQAMVNSARSRRTGALLFIDLDHFKNLNDTRGHDVGDLLLQQAAQRLTAAVRAGDTVARLGGDEFVILLEGLDEVADRAARETRAVGEKILAAFGPDFQLGSIEYHISASIGASLFSGGADSIDELLKRADLAMYQAKSAGRDALRFYDPQTQALVSARAALEADLRRAVLAGQFALHFQPQVHADGRIVGAEALLRWHHPERGLVPPAEFIPVAEESGLIVPLGQWVIEAACRQLQAWQASPSTASLMLSINVSSRQFRRPDFVPELLAVLRRSGAQAGRLKLELTESLLLDDVEETIFKMMQLRMQGVGFSLDDFGTGYSSLAYLKRLPLDQLKIDQSFVRDILSDANDAAIARTVVALGTSLGLTVIAEGVETEGQRRVLAGLGCQVYQGYLYSRPVPADAFEQFLDSRAAALRPA